MPLNKFGYEVEEVEDQSTPGDQGAAMVKVTMADHSVVMPASEYATIVAESKDSEEFVENMTIWKQESASEWAQERGPNSELAANMEAGTPTTDHSSDPA